MRKKIDERNNQLQGQVAKILQQHHERVQLKLTQVQNSQPDPQALQVLGNDCKALQGIVKTIQGAVGDLARQVPTTKEVKTLLEL